MMRNFLLDRTVALVQDDFGHSRALFQLARPGSFARSGDTGGRSRCSTRTIKASSTTSIAGPTRRSSISASATGGGRTSPTCCLRSRPRSSGLGQEISGQRRCRDAMKPALLPAFRSLREGGGSGVTGDEHDGVARAVRIVCLDVCRDAGGGERRAGAARDGLHAQSRPGRQGRRLGADSPDAGRSHARHGEGHPAGLRNRSGLRRRPHCHHGGQARYQGPRR